jgi:uncharacterized surface protein with fasciclin (FAS1) repeats
MTFTGCNKDEVEEPAPRDIVDLILATPELSSLTSAINAAEVINTLKGTGPYTFLAPTNDAFKKLPDGVYRALLDNPDKLTNLLLYHTLTGNTRSSDFTTGSIAPFYKRDGLIEVEIAAGSVILNGSASIIGPDNEVTNGMVHIIDEVLIPAEFELPN